MLFKNNPYYHETIKNLITAFGSLFSDLTIVHYDDDGEKQKVIQVPIAYGPKNKWLSRLKEQPDLNKGGVQITLPRMAFEITNYRYDSTRKIGTQGTFVTGSIGDSRAKVFNPVPYDVFITLSTLAKDQDDSLKMLEQILPYFSPQLTLSVELLPQFGIRKDVPIILGDVQIADNYDGPVDQFRVVEQTFSFVAKIDLFGPILSSSKIIKQANVDMTTPETKYTAKVNPFSATKDEAHTVDETLKQ